MPKLRPRSNGLARAVLRFRPAAFAGTFVALFLAVAIVSACGILLETGARASTPPTRYAGAPVVVAADQQARLRMGRGDGAYEVAAPLPDRARVDAALLQRLAPLGRAVPDVVFPVRDGAGRTLDASGWGSTGFSPAELRAGRAPAGPGEVVLGGAARTGSGSTPPPGSGSSASSGAPTGPGPGSPTPRPAACRDTPTPSTPSCCSGPTRRGPGPPSTAAPRY